MIDTNFIKEAYDELKGEYDIKTSVIDKYAFDITINPASIIGAITGSLVGKKQAEKQILKSHMNNIPTPPSIGGSYYKEVDNIANNLTVMFTPLSAVYSVRNGNRNVSIDTIETSEMDDEMYNAWRRRDENYFKNLIMNKMMGEIQLVEHMYAKRLISKKDELNKAMGKQASEYDSDTDIGFSKMVDEVCILKSIVEDTENSKIAEYLFDSIQDDDTINLSWKLERPIDKYASLLSGVSGFFGLDTNRQELKSMKKGFEDPSYLNKNLKVGFLPDRVVFIVDNVAVSQLPAMNMNDEGFERFEDKDNKYFENFFKSEVVKPISDTDRINQVIDSMLSFEKKASDSDIFKKNNIHPMIYFEELTKRYGNDWLSFDPDILIDEIEKDYKTKVEEIPMNKILTVQLLNVSSYPFVNPFCFEKCVRSLNDKPIDFEEWQTNNSGGEIMFAIQVMDDLTPGDNIFDNFSELVVKYIVDILAAQDYYTITVKDSVINSELEKNFFDILNSDLLAARQKLSKSEMTEESEESINKQEEKNSSIHRISKDILIKLRENNIYDGDAINNFVNSLFNEGRLDENLINMIKKNIRKNLSIDIMLQKKQELLDAQKEI